MPTTYTPSSAGALVLAYTQPSDTDARNAASVNQTTQGIANDVARLAAGKQTTALVQRTYNNFEYGIDPATQSIHWVRNHNTLQFTNTSWRQVRTSTADVTNDTAIYLPFRPPHGSTLTTYQVYIDVPTVHSNLPSIGGSMPRVVVSKIDITTGLITTIDTITDGSASLLTYETAHSVGNLGLTEVIDRTKYVYQFTIFGESGTNAVDGLVVCGARNIYSISAVDQGAG